MKKAIYIVIVVLVMTHSSLIAAFANSDDLLFHDTYEYQGIEIINPKDDIIYSDYLLISLKIKDPCRFNLSISSDIGEEEKEGIDILQVTTSDSAIKFMENKESSSTQKENYIYICNPVTVINEGSLDFYTIQLEDLIKGNYCILIEVLDKEDKVTKTIMKEFKIEKKELKPKKEVDNAIVSKGTPAFKSLSDIIKSIFDK